MAYYYNEDWVLGGPASAPIRHVSLAPAIGMTFLLLALTLVGHAASLRADPDSPAAEALRAAGRRVSAAVGG